jgi:hypothetical protein
MISSFFESYQFSPYLLTRDGGTIFLGARKYRQSHRETNNQIADVNDHFPAPVYQRKFE